MSKIEVWGTGKPLAGFTQDDVLTSARKGFPKAKAQHIARFIAGKRFLITHAKDEASAQKLIEGLAKAGIEADTAGPPKSEPVAAEIETSADDEEAHLEEIDDAEPPPVVAATPVPAGKRWKLVAGIVGALVVVIAAGVLILRQRVATLEQESENTAEAKARVSLAARRGAEAEARRQADEEAAAQAKAQAAEAQRLQKIDAAITEINNAFAQGDYPNVIALADRFELMYGPDPQVRKLQDNAIFTLKEGARRGNFGAILNAQVKGSVSFNALRDWALQAQERAKPVH